MQFRDLKTQYKYLERDINAALSKVMKECNFINGTQVRELEEELAEYVGVKYCITCGNGTDALTMMMMAWDIGEGDAVFVPDFTFFASGEVVSFGGATPVFFDVCHDTFNSDVQSLERAILAVQKEEKLRPRAIIAVDLFGQPANYQELEKVAEKYDLLLLEDGAQGFGGRIGERKACSFGNAATTSFFPAKPLGCYGDGGAIFINDESIAEYLRSIRVHGKGVHKYDNVRIGWNSRLDTLQAAILQVKLGAFKEYELEKVNEVASIYLEHLKGVVELPYVCEGYYSSWAQYTIKLSSRQVRDDLQVYLTKKGVPTMIYYPLPMHMQRAFDKVKQYVDCTVSECLSSQVLSLPMHPYLEHSDIEAISNLITKFFEEKN